MLEKLLTKKWQKNGISYFYYFFQKFSAYKVNFFPTDSNLESNFAFYDTNIKCLQKIFFLHLLALFANFKTKSGRNGSKTKNLFYKCALKFHSDPFPAWETPFCQKKVKILETLVHTGGTSTVTRT